jgi:hypothetical protein
MIQRNTVPSSPGLRMEAVCSSESNTGPPEHEAGATTIQCETFWFFIPHTFIRICYFIQVKIFNKHTDELIYEETFIATTIQWKQSM